MKLKRPSKLKIILIATVLWPLIKDFSPCESLRELIRDIEKDYSPKKGKVTKEVDGEFTY